MVVSERPQFSARLRREMPCGVLAIDLPLERLGRALIGQDAVEALAEILAAGAAVKLADDKPQQHAAQADALVPDLARGLVLLAQVLGRRSAGSTAPGGSRDHG